MNKFDCVVEQARLLPGRDDGTSSLRRVTEDCMGRKQRECLHPYGLFRPELLRLRKLLHERLSEFTLDFCCTILAAIVLQNRVRNCLTLPIP